MADDTEIEEQDDGLTVDDIALAAMQGMLAQPGLNANVICPTVWTVIVPAFLQAREQFYTKVLPGFQRIEQHVKDSQAKPVEEAE